MKNDIQAGDWVTVEGVYMQVMERISVFVYSCRLAGETATLDVSVAKMDAASIRPDFSNAKSGDKCFSAANGIISIIDIKEFTRGKIIFTEHQPYSDNGLYCQEDQHPTLFNSHAQFKAYWKECELNMEEGDEG